jgi:hypothetical protein
MGSRGSASLRISLSSVAGSWVLTAGVGSVDEELEELQDARATARIEI